MATVAQLAIEVESRGTTRATQELDRLRQSAGGASGSFTKLIPLATKAGAATAAIATAAAAAATAVTLFTASQAKSVKETQRLASVAGLTASEFERIAFIAGTAGIEAESLGDQFKDINDRLGEFVSVGTGAFQDIADVLGLSASEAQRFAIELSNLSGEDQLRRIAEAFDEAGVSANAATFATESLANDLSYLIPLFRDGAKEADELAGRYNEVAGALALTSEQNADLQEFGATFRLLGETFAKAGQQIAATVSEYLIPILNKAITVIGDATVAIQSFFAQFKSPENIKSIAVLNDQLSEEIQRIDILTARLEKLGESESLRAAGLKAEIQFAKNRAAGIYAQIKAIKALEAAESGTGRDKPKGSIGGGSGVLFDPEAEAEKKKQDRLQRDLENLQASLLSEEEAIRAAEESKLQIIEDARYRGLVSEQEYADAVKQIQEQANNDVAASNAQRLNQTINAATQFGSAISSLMQTFGQESAELFRANQALQIAQATINSYAAYTQAIATYPPPVGQIMGAASLAAGLAQVAAISSQAPPRAQGGQVLGGQPYLVGERGPELFMPNGTGSIVPNHKMGGSSGGGITIINQTTGRIDETETREDEQGRMIITIRETVSRDLANSNSDISKALGRNTKAQRDRI